MPTDRLRKLLESIAANTVALRTRASLTQEQLAERAELDLRYLQRVERAGTNLSMKVLVALAKGLGVREADLLLPATLPRPKRGRPPNRTSA